MARLLDLLNFYMTVIDRAPFGLKTDSAGNILNSLGPINNFAVDRNDNNIFTAEDFNFLPVFEIFDFRVRKALNRSPHSGPVFSID